MSETRKRALRPQVDRHAADYADALLDIALNTIDERLQKTTEHLREENKRLRLELQQLRQQFDAINRDLDDQRQLDRYALTRRKVVRLLQSGQLDAADPTQD